MPAVTTTNDLGDLARRAGGRVGAAQKAFAEVTPEDAAEACLVPPGLVSDLLAMSAQCKASIVAIFAFDYILTTLMTDL